MTRKALPSELLHKSEVTYKDTGVSKNKYAVPQRPPGFWPLQWTVNQ